MKYRRLSKEELETFEKEFIDFLVINGVTADDWLEIKENNKVKAEAIINQFSDVIFESILRKNQYLDFISQKSIKTFHFLNNEIVLVGVDAPKDSQIDFTSNINTDLSDLEVYTTSKQYKKQREIEMFDLIKAGGQLADGELFKKLCLLL